MGCSSERSVEEAPNKKQNKAEKENIEPNKKDQDKEKKEQELKEKE